MQSSKKKEQNESLVGFSQGSRVKQTSFNSTVGITTAKSVLLENTTVRNTSSGYHPMFQFKKRTGKSKIKTD